MEQQFIDWLRESLPDSPLLRVGIGDDAAVLRWAAGGDMVITTDAVTDQIDFRLADITPEQVGHKALGVNLSDLAAMAAEPVVAVVSLVLPRDGALELALGIYRGLLPLAERFGVTIAGGDTNVWDGALVVSITAIGRTSDRGPLTRRGARPGDAFVVTGSFGGSIRGRHLAVEPRVREALRLNAEYKLNAGMDVSDGLALDASRLAAASGCGVALDLDAIPISREAVQLAKESGRTPLDHALGDGEDFELLLAVPADEAERLVREQPLQIPVTRIGGFVEGEGLWKQKRGGEMTPLEATGYLH